MEPVTGQAPLHLSQRLNRRRSRVLGEERVCVLGAVGKNVSKGAGHG
jgi:hypothetical protein